MSSKVSIANRAAAKLGDDRILLLTDDTKTARTINGMFDEVRDAELRRYHWKFAITRDALPALAAAPAWGFAYQYPLPADYLGMVQVNDYILRGNKQKPPFSIESGRILTDYSAPLKIRYIQRIENTALYDPLFVELFACKLAMESCETLTQSEAKYNRCAEAYKFALSEAIRQDAIEKAPDELPWGTWLESRGGICNPGSGDPWQSYPGVGT
jgi:hypothetical protein